MNKNSINNATVINDKRQLNYRSIIQSNKIESNFDRSILSKSTTKGARKVEFSGLERLNNESDTNTEDISEQDVTAGSLEESVNDETSISTTRNGNENSTVQTTTNTPSTTTSNPLATILNAIIHKFQFTPQTFFQDRLESFKQALAQLGLLPAFNNTSRPKQLLNPNGLIHLAGLDDNGFYTNRLEPAGFLGGNGWFANKGGLLGGPGAIISTGSVLTDYPTSYRKKK